MNNVGEDGKEFTEYQKIIFKAHALHARIKVRVAYAKKRYNETLTLTQDETDQKNQSHND